MNVLTMNLEKKAHVSLYEQIYSFIKNEIKEGILLSGEKLPSKRSLVQHLEVSQNTIEAAYEQLLAEGYIESVARKGYYVCEIEDGFYKEKVMLKDKEEGNQEEEEYQYNLLSNTVDLSGFPYQAFRKIYKETLQIENKELFQLGDSRGDEYLRETIAKYLHASRGVMCEPEQIVVGAGTEYLMQIIIQLLGKQSIYGVENPGYPKTYKILRAHGIKVNPIGVDEQGMSLEGLRLGDTQIAYITPSHQFPLGVVMSINRRLSLLRWVNEQEGRYIIEDDYDSEFRFNGRPIPALQGLDQHGKVIYISTFSRSIAPSIRISYMVLPMELLRRYKKHLAFYASTVSRVEQRAIYRFIEEGYFERHLNKMKTIYKNRKEYLVKELKKNIACITIKGEDAGLHLILGVENGMSEEELVEKAKRRGVKVTGISTYYLENVDKTQEKKQPLLVIGYSHLTEELMDEIIKELSLAWVRKD